MIYDLLSPASFHPSHRELDAILDAHLAPLARFKEDLDAVNRIKHRSLRYAHKVSCASFKTAEEQVCESYLEADARRLFDADYDVIFYRTQPIKLRFPHHARLTTYIPDAVTLSRDLKLTFIEVKPSADYSIPETREHYDLIAKELSTSGCGFRVLTEAEIRREPSFFFFKHFHRTAFSASAEDVRMLMQWLKQAGDKSTIENVRKMMPGKAMGAVVRAIYEGRLALQLTSKRDGIIYRRKRHD